MAHVLFQFSVCFTLISLFLWENPILKKKNLKKKRKRYWFSLILIGAPFPPLVKDVRNSAQVHSPVELATGRGSLPFRTCPFAKIFLPLILFRLLRLAIFLFFFIDVSIYIFFSCFGRAFYGSFLVFSEGGQFIMRNKQDLANLYPIFEVFSYGQRRIWLLGSLYGSSFNGIFPRLWKKPAPWDEFLLCFGPWNWQTIDRSVFEEDESITFHLVDSNGSDRRNIRITLWPSSDCLQPLKDISLADVPHFPQSISCRIRHKRQH